MNTNKTGQLLTENIAGVNRILPHKHKYAWDLFLKSCANNWMPTEISMQNDIKQWKGDEITEDEKLLVKRCLGFFAGSESLVGNNLLLSAFKYITDAECRQYILRQAFEESLHNLTVVYICDSLDLDIDEVYTAYETIPSIKAKDDFLMSITNDLTRNDFSTSTVEGKQELLRNFLTYWIVCEGTFFFSGFAMLLALGRQNKLQGVSDQIKYTLRDESSHIAFGTYLINTLIEQNPEIWTKEIQDEFVNHIKKAVELEIAYAHDVLPTGILGLNAEMFVDYMHYIGNRRLEGIGLDFRFPSDKNPFPWLGEVVDVQAMGNFFERRVREYQQAGSLEDDF
ncbi:MAG: ribonucleotide-diphosphate reductase subunit beta [Cellvibrionales bacterium]|jgi:ribonucleoside-diphosphate reductase beta chain|nr:ribonucleotide-diphosphate reductase subunit beta [Cellvibrionales bacterium]